MLISHRYQFIFLKPLKAAGTSVECFLEPLCRETPCVISEYGSETISAHGIVGYRGSSKGDSTYWHHMPANLVQKLHPDLFRNYRKISIVRNPYQKAISLFLWIGPLSYREAMDLAFKEPNQLRSLFLLFLKHQIKDLSLLTDASRLLIDSQLVIDHILYFEKLEEGLVGLVDRLSLPLSIQQLGWFKQSGCGSAGHCLEQYYCDASLDLINERCAWYFSLFDYDKYESMDSLLTSTRRMTRSSVPRFQAE